MKKILKIIVIIAVIILGFVGYKMWQKHKNKPEWRMEQARIFTIREIVTASGSISPVTSVDIGTEVSGKVEKIYTDFNQTVKKGELLAKIDTETLELNLQEVETSLQSARSTAQDVQLDVQLLTELVEKNMSAEYDLQKAQIRLEQAQQSVARMELSYQKAQKNLQNAHIYSPIDGVIISRNVDEGQTVAASLNAPTLFIIANDLTKMQIEASVDEADIGRIELGMPVFFNVDAFLEERFTGIVRQVRLSPKNESNVVTYSVIIDVDNPDMLLLPGMTANVSIIVNEKKDILTASSRALQFKPSKELWESFGLKWDNALLMRNRPNRKPADAKQGTPQDKPQEPQRATKKNEESVDVFKLRAAYNANKVQEGFVWVLEDNKPKSIPVTTGVSDGNNVEILSGLEEGQNVIVGVTYKAKQKKNKDSAMMGMRR
ncbi:MAG: efflux RND transporter periplasmic adaptor subunit [Candidatus Cloacimonetes bacterium]|nr:efflux RND transporter periplasmic adaptor subunit [Candidatus Cloacimonadota bacterium]